VSALVGLLGALVLYLRGVGRLRRRGTHWPRWRTAAFAAGAATVVAAVLPPIGPADGRFVAHMLQHFLMGMLGPLLLALGAPMTLVVRSSTRQGRRRILRLLHRSPVHLLAHPVVASLLAVGSLWVLYLTPLYATTETHPLLHAVLHLHVLASGFLFAWVFVGADPVPRTSFRLRSASLVTAFALHAILAKMLYVGGLPGAGITASERQLGAQLLWYGGDISDVALLVAFFGRWYQHSAHAPTAQARSFPQLTKALDGQPNSAAAGAERREQGLDQPNGPPSAQTVHSYIEEAEPLLRPGPRVAGP